MQNSPQQSQPVASGGGSDFDEAVASVDELHAQVAAAEGHILELERDLEGVAAKEARLSDDLDAERARRSDLDQQLGEARQEASRFALKIAFEMRDAAAAEAEQTLTDARRESESLLNAGRERLRVAESETAGRLAELEAEHQTLSEQIRVMEALYGELQATLQLVAETSVKELVKTQDSLKQLDPVSGQGPRPESASEQTTTSDSAPLDEAAADLEAPSNPAGEQPAATENPPLTSSA